MKQHLFALAMVTAFFVIFVFFKLCKKKTTSNSPPSPPRLPIIGNLHQLGSLPHRSLEALSRKYGPIMLLHLGSSPTIVVSSAETAREVMKNHDLIFASRPSSSMFKRLMYDCTDVALSPYGEYWRQVRKICVIQLLSPKQVQSFRPVREEEVSDLVAKIRESSGGLVNLSAMTVNLTNNVICRVALGKKYFGEEGGGRNFADMLKELLYLLGTFPVRDFIPWLGWLDSLRGLDARVRRSFREIDDFLNKVIDEHMCSKSTASDRDGKGARDFVDVLLSLDDTDDTAGISITRDNMKAVILDMFSAGTDTTFSAIDWVLVELMRNPLVMKRAQEEIRQAIKCEGKITEENIDNMKYLKAIIKEGLRLHPPAPLLVPRETTEYIKLEGYDVPAGTRVMVNASAIGRDAKSYDRPEEFDPERFMNCDIDFKGQDFQLIPFGAGRRGCPGVGFAMAIIELVLAHLLHHFDFELPGGLKGEELDMAEFPGISTSRRSNLIVAAKPRLP